MTLEQRTICLALGNLRFLPGTFDKRFSHKVSSIAEHTPDKELSEKQIEWIYKLLYKYRKQIPMTYENFKSNPLCAKI